MLCLLCSIDFFRLHTWDIKKNLFGDEEFLLVEFIFYIIWTPNEGFTLDSSRYTGMSALVCQ